MTLAAHTRLGPYEILASLGAGGMGQVYRAIDTRLEREVAIKVLPEEFVEDGERLRRFEREAKVLASLNHPNIAQIFGVDHERGIHYLVLELVEGENLAERIAREPPPIEEALDICRQIAEGLEVAHESGVIHRDLKPANVRVTPQGNVKLLDFGLAKSLASKTAHGRGTAAESDSAAMTRAGVVLGTPTYMSPEQARGKPVDRRADVWAFGCVLFECLSGARAFDGDSIGNVLASILHDEPDWSRLPAATPARAASLVRRCLVKDPRQRLRDIGDARIELEDALGARDDPALERPAADASRGSARALRLGLGIAALLLACAAAGWWIAVRNFPSYAVAPQVFHVSIPVPADAQFDGLAAIAADASYLLYHASPKQQQAGDHAAGWLTLRRLDRDETKVVDGSEGALSAALSPNGRWLAFLVPEEGSAYEMTLKKAPLDHGRQAGPPVTVCAKLPGLMTLCFASDEELVLAMAFPEGRIAVVSVDGGAPRVVAQEPAENDKGLRGWWQPRPLPGGRAVLVTHVETQGATVQRDIEWVDLATGDRTRVLENAAQAAHTATGHVIALREGALVAAPFDLASREVIGGAVAVIAGAAEFGIDPSFDTSRTGALAMVHRPALDSQRRLAWIEAGGRAAQLELPSGPYEWLQISRDGRRVAYQHSVVSDADRPDDVWVHDLERRTTVRLKSSGFLERVIWNPDGQRLTYGSGMTRGDAAIWERRADGTDEPQRLHSADGTGVWVTPLDWTSDGRVLAFQRFEGVTGRDRFDLWMLQRGEDGAESTATPYLSTSSTSRADTSFSPDGQWICYGSNESGHQELYVQRFSAPSAGADDARAGRWKISTGGGRCPWWRADGRELRYVDDERRLMSVQVETAPSFSVSTPAPLLRLGDLETFGEPRFTDDGRILAILQGGAGELTRIDLVLNWFAELEASVPMPQR